MTNLKENTPSVAQQNSEDTFKDKQQETLLKPEVLMSWTTKATPFPPKEIMKTQFGLLLGPIMLTALGAAIMWDRLPGAFFELIRNCSFAYGLYIYFIIFPLRQKTRFNYSITRDNGHIKYCVDYSTASKIFFQRHCHRRIYFLHWRCYLHPISAFFNWPRRYCAWRSQISPGMGKRNKTSRKPSLERIQRGHCRSQAIGYRHPAHT
ncbi:hypothetical protein [Pseudomonas protegens]|uniref:hypothetical protein n=1 Tax=Pseudomonas protegens TaxID=380021 RepID=UPI0011AF77A8|nr:hypothetical protein [Pseudomonas protegens]BCQ63560.1 hypothetical protein PBOI14_53100 [Pseudomonas sp. Boi14]